jgi:hypothetical protein
MSYEKYMAGRRLTHNGRPGREEMSLKEQGE